MLSFVAVQSTLCYPMDFSTPRSSVLHDLPEFAQIHVHWISYVTISSSITPFSFCLQSFPASGSFPINWLLASGGSSALVLVLPKNLGLIYFTINWVDLPAVQGTLKSKKKKKRVFSSTTIQKHQFFGAQLALWANSHIHTWLLEKP